MPPGASEVRALRAVHEDPLFRATRSPYAVLDRSLRIHAANPAYHAATLREPEETLGRYLFDVFPESPVVREAGSVARLTASLVRVLRRKVRDDVGALRYDVLDRDGTRYVEKMWVTVNSPLVDDEDRLIGLLVHSEDITPLWAMLPRPAADTATRDGARPDGPAHGIAGDGAPGDSSTPGRSRLARTVVTITPQSDGPADSAPVPGPADSLTVTALARQLAADNSRLRRKFERHAAIEQAKGVLMATRRCAPDEAFRLLTEISQTTNTKLWKVATQVVAEALDPDGS